VKTYPGLLAYETFQDAKEHNRYVVMTTWQVQDA
jgi:heme-degrading monooxygenase HmoA